MPVHFADSLAVIHNDLGKLVIKTDDVGIAVIEHWILLKTEFGIVNWYTLSQIIETIKLQVGRSAIPVSLKELQHRS